MKRVLGVLCLLALLSVAPFQASAAPGDPDAGFGQGGLSQLTPTGAYPVFQDMVMTGDGGFLAVGGTRSGVRGILARFLPDGDPDPSFGNGGVVTSPDSTWRMVQVDDAGRFVAFGRSGADAAVARFTPDGQLDPTFGTGGLRILPVRDQFENPDPRIVPRSPGLDPEGRIVAAVEMSSCSISGEGEGKWIGGYEICGSLALVRLTSDGDLDPTFGDGDGIRVVGTRSNPGMAFAPDGKMILAGSDYTDYGDADVPNDGTRWIRRLDADGKVDEGFGKDGGWELHDHGDHGRPTLIHVDGDGSVTIAYGLAVNRLNSRGRPDRSFGKNGAAAVDVESLHGSTRLWLDGTDGHVADDHMYLSGTALGGGRPRARFAFVVRLTPAGEPDPTFDNDGVALQSIGHALRGWGRNHPATDDTTVVPDRRGRVTVATTGGEKDLQNFSLARFRGGTGVRLSCRGVPATVQGTSGNDHLFAGEVTVAGPGDDVIEGSGGLVCAGPGDDRYEVSHDGADTVLLGPGDDVIHGDANRVDGGAGKDRIKGIIYRADGGPGDDLVDTRAKHVIYKRFSLTGGAGDDVLLAGPGPSLLRGDGGRDTLRGGPGEDRLFGGAGNDRLFGEQGADFLSGGPGTDLLRGGDDGPDYRRFGISRARIKGHIDLLPGRVARGHVRVKAKCWNEGGDPTEQWTQSIGRGMKIKHGRIKDDFDWEAWGDYSYGGTRATVTQDSIKVSYSERWGFQGTIAAEYRCNTGDLHFTLRPRPAPRQILRP